MKNRQKNRYFTATLDSNATTFNPMEIRGGSDHFKPRQTQDWSAKAVIKSSNTNWNNSNLERYRNLYTAIYTMADLPDDHDFYVDRDAVNKAADLLAVMRENFSIDPPKVLPQDGEAVVFTWELGDFKRYLTIDASDYDIMDVNRKAQIRCIHDITGDDQWSLVKLIEAMGAKPVSSSSAE